jgi:hypothetical protein
MKELLCTGHIWSMHHTKTTDKLLIDKLWTMTVIDWIVGHGSLFYRTSTPEKVQVVGKLITPTETKGVNRNNPQEDSDTLKMSQSMQLSLRRNSSHGHLLSKKKAAA